MNILVISPAIYPCVIGGVEIFNYYLIKGLVKKGNKIWVITNCSYDWNHRNIHLVKVNERFLLNPTLSTLFHLFLELITLKRKIDVIHVPYTSNSILAYPILFARKFLNIQYIIIIHGGGMRPWKPKILHKIFFMRANTIVAVSTTIKKEYEKRSGRKIKVIPALIPFRESKIPRRELRKKYGFGYDDKIILSLGSIRKIKGSDTLLDAFLDLGKTYVEQNNLKLLYVGEGIMKPILTEKVKKGNFYPYVKFLGNIPYKEVSNMYKLADIYVISSLFEGSPIALLEAMFNGLPIIGADVNGINNLIKHGENGLIFDKENRKDLMKRIKELVENKNARELGIAAKKDYLKNWNFESVVSEHNRLCERLCKQKNE